jgi:hypothetical protein
MTYSYKKLSVNGLKVIREHWNIKQNIAEWMT